MEVERLTAVLEVGGLGGLQTSLAAADRFSDTTKRNLGGLAEVSRIATDALQRVKMTAAQALETGGAAEAVKRSVSSVSDVAMRAADHLDAVKLDASHAASTAAAADSEVHSINKIGRAAEETTAKIEVMKRAGGSGGPGMFGVGRGILLPAALGVGASVLPALGPATLGLAGAGLAMGTTAIGAAGTAYLGLHGLSTALGGDKKAFDALNQSQKQFVQTLRSLNTGLTDVASNAMLPGLTKAIHEMFTPTLVNAMTAAVREFGGAIGEAGQLFGRYFGSRQFAELMGPLAKAGAQGLVDLSHVVLSLTDAFGVLARAAIPLTNWLGDLTVKGARMFDVWLRGKDATGALTSAMTSTEASFRQWGDLLGGLIHLLGALGSALYPVSQVALKDLTNGLDYLAGVINRNKQTIQEIVAAALAAFVQAIRIALPIVSGLAHGLEVIVNIMGGWKVAFELVLGGTLAMKFLALAKAIGLVGTATNTAAGMSAARLAGSLEPAVVSATGKVAGLRAMLLSLGSTAVLGAIAAAGAALLFDKQGFDNFVSSKLPSWLGGGHNTLGPGSTVPGFARGAFESAGLTLNASGQIVGKTSTAPNAQAAMKAAHGGGMAVAARSTQTYTQAQLARLWVQAGGDPTVASTMAAIAMAESKGSSSASHVNTNGTIDRGLWQINSSHGYGTSSFDPLANVKQAVSVYNSQGLGAWSTYNNGAYANYMAGGAGSSVFGTPPPWTSGTGTTGQTAAQKAAAALAAQLKTLHQQVTTEGKTISDDLKHKLISPDVAASLQKRVADLNKQLDGAGKNALPGIRQNLANVKSALSEGVKQATAVSNFTDAISKLKTSLQAKLAQTLGTPQTYATPQQLQAAKTAAEKITKQLTDGLLTPAALAQARSKLSQLQQTITSGMNGMMAAVQAAQTAFNTGWSTLVSAGDAEFQAETQAHVQAMTDAMNAQVSAMQTQMQNTIASMQVNVQPYGFMFGGNITEVPAQSQLNALEKQHRDQQLSQQLAADRAKGDAQAVANDLYQMKVNSLSDLATAEQQAASKQLKDAQDAYQSQMQAQIAAYQKEQQAAISNYQTQRALQKTAMDQQIADLENAYNNRKIDSKTFFNDLLGIYKDNGVKLDGITVVLGGKIYDGVKAWSDPIMTLMDNLQAKIQQTQKMLGMPVSKVPALPTPVVPAPTTLTPAQLATSEALYNWGQSTQGIKGYATGGPTGSGGLAILHPDEFVVPKGGALVKGGGGGGQEVLEVHTHVHLNGTEITEVVYRELLRKARRNRGQLWQTGIPGGV